MPLQTRKRCQGISRTKLRKNRQRTSKQNEQPPWEVALVGLQHFEKSKQNGLVLILWVDNCVTTASCSMALDAIVSDIVSIETLLSGI